LEIGFLHTNNNDIVVSIFVIIIALTTFVIFVSVCVICGILGLRDSRSIQYSVLTSEDLTSVEVGFDDNEQQAIINSEEVKSESNNTYQFAGEN